MSCHRTRSEVGYDPLSYSDIVLYAQTHGFFGTKEKYLVFERLIQACDHAFLEYANEQQRKEIARMKAASS